jgi:CRP/FNR family cyclic AMP-dependent transcriptional regulator
VMKKPHVFNVLTREGWLAEIDPLLARSIIDAGRLLVLRRGDSLFHPNDEPGGMYGVVEGGIIISALGRDGLPVAGHIHRQCGWFGYGSFLERQRRLLIPVANEASKVLHMPLGELDRLNEAYPMARAAFAKLSVRTETIYIAALTDLLIPNTDRRLAAVLMRVTGIDGPLCDSRRPINPEREALAGPEGVPLTQTLLAELANASPHTVARFVERLMRAGWIAWSYGRVRILNSEALAAFAQQK